MNIVELAGCLNEIAVTDGGVLSSDSRGVVEQICRQFVRGDAQVHPPDLGLNMAAHNVLWQYASSCAVEAVREHSTDRLKSGLAALVVENGVIDIRDTVRAAAKLFHSASLLTMDTTALFDHFAQVSRSEILASHLRQFSLPPGSPELRLRRFGLRTSGTGNTFRYKDDESLTMALRMYINAPNLTLSNRFWLILRLLRSESEKWQFWKRQQR